MLNFREISGKFLGNFWVSIKKKVQFISVRFPTVGISLRLIFAKHGITEISGQRIALHSCSVSPLYRHRPDVLREREREREGECVRVRVCVFEYEHESERERERERERDRVCVHVLVYKYESEREGEREGKRERGRKRESNIYQ